MTAEDRGWGRGWPDCRRDDLVDIGAGRDNVAFPAGIRRGVAGLFTAFLDEFDNDVEKLQPGWCWGFACRAIRGTNRPSNHSWGLAVDVNAPLHPMGQSGTFSRSGARRCRQLAGQYMLRWGGDYTRRPDEMHFEFMGTPQDAERLAERHDTQVRAPDSEPVAPGSGITYETPKDRRPGERILKLGNAGTDVAFVQRFLGENDDGYFGPVTEDAVEGFQESQELTVDGIVGGDTWRAMGQPE